MEPNDDDLNLGLAPAAKAAATAPAPRRRGVVAAGAAPAAPSSAAAKLGKLPEANEFSPGQVVLREVLEIVHDLPGDRDQQIEALRAEYFTNSAMARTDPDERMKQQRTRAYNVRIGMKGYGLLSFEDNLLTDLGSTLLAEIDDTQMYRRFATHILEHLHGIEVLQAIRRLQAREHVVSKSSLAEELRRSGFATLPVATTHHTKLIGWLRLAGVVKEPYDVQFDVVRDLTGVSIEAVADWEGTTYPQRAFLRALRRIAETSAGPWPVKDVTDSAVVEHGPVFRDDQLRADVLKPLETAGWIATSGTGLGRGGKSGTVGATEKLSPDPPVRLA